MCAPLDFAELLLARVGVPPVPVEQPVRPLVTGATPPSAAGLPRRAAELVAAQFDTAAAAAEGCDALVATGIMPTGVWHDRACGGDRRRRPDGADVGGRAGVGGRRRRDRRAARQPGPRRLARRRSALTHHRGPRSARNRRSVPRGGTGGAGRGVRHDVRLDISDFPTRHPYGLGLWQNHIERILAGWVGELAVPIYRGREVTGFAQDDTGVDVELSDGQSLRAQYLVGCDGGRSLVRKAAGIEFPGWDPTTSSLIAEVEMTEEPELGIRRDALGIHALGKVEYEIRDGEVVYKDRGHGTGHGDRSRTSEHERAHPARSQRGPHRRLRDRLRDPQSHLDLQVHRHDSAGRGLPRRDGSCWPATRRTCIPRSVDRASTPVCRMR